MCEVNNNNKASNMPLKNVKLNLVKGWLHAEDKFIIAKVSIPIKIKEKSYQYLYEKSIKNKISVSEILSLLINSIPEIIELEFEE